MPRMSGDKMVANRMAVMDLWHQEPKPTYAAISKQLALPDSTVRHIVYRFRDRDDEQLVAKRNDGPRKVK